MLLTTSVVKNWDAQMLDIIIIFCFVLLSYYFLCCKLSWWRNKDVYYIFSLAKRLNRSRCRLWVIRVGQRNHVLYGIQIPH